MLAILVGANCIVIPEEATPCSKNAPVLRGVMVTEVFNASAKLWPNSLARKMLKFRNNYSKRVSWLYGFYIDLIVEYCAFL